MNYSIATRELAQQPIIFTFPDSHRRQIRSTYPLEHLNGSRGSLAFRGENARNSERPGGIFAICR